MLIRFTISNFLSFNEKQEFSMIAGAGQLKKEHIINTNNLKLLKFSSLYGANASGKSNLLKAISFMKKVIKNGVKANTMNLYCRSHEENRNKISTFDCEIKIDNKFFSYGFDMLLSKSQIVDEWLYELTKDKEIQIYTRNQDEDIKINNNYFENNKDIIDRLKIYGSDLKTQDNVLFLTSMNRDKENIYNEFNSNNITILKKVYDWFNNILTVIFPNDSIDYSTYLTSDKSLNQINKIVSSLGTGIEECKLDPLSMDELSVRIPLEIYNKIKETLMSEILREKENSKFVKANAVLKGTSEMYFIDINNNMEFSARRLVLKHKNDDGKYYFSEESDGTRRIFDLIDILLNKDTEKVYFIDELDRCLHPQLTYEFVKRFLNDIKNTQLIVTTHESRLLNFELLRRDEIWFADREQNAPTRIYSLEDYNERFDKKIDKAYLDGRYRGIPIFESIFPVDERS